jgi:outer membrane protein assembly factor BamB
MRHIIPFFLISFVSILSCNPLSEKKRSLNIVKTNKFLELKLDDSTPNISDGMVYFDDLNQFLFNLNWSENSIQIYDVNNKEKTKDLKFNYEGPDGVLDVFGIYVHNLDSVFLFNQLINQFTIIDTSGNIKSKVKYEIPDNYSPAFVHNSYFLSPPIIVGENLIVKTHHYGAIREMSNDELKNQNLLYSINMKTGKNKFLGIKYPEDYLLGGKKVYEPSIAFRDGRFVISYFGDHRIFYVDDLDKEVESKEMKSEFILNQLPFIPEDGTGNEARNYLYESPRYETLFYDKYRDLFLRFVFHEFKLDSNIPKFDLRNHSGPFSIQFIDSDLNLMDEMKFEENIYNPYNFFITREGLYISINHPLNPSSKEDFLSFELFSLDM